MKPELQELIRDARKELRKAAGVPLTPGEQIEDSHAAAVGELETFLLSRLGVSVLLLLREQVIWTDQGPTAVLKTESCIFHLRKAAGTDPCILSIVEADEEREIARIDASDPHFSSRVLAAIGDETRSTE